MTDQPKATSLLVKAKTDDLKVRTRDGDALGTIYSLMVDKRSGQSTTQSLASAAF